MFWFVNVVLLATGSCSLVVGAFARGIRLSRG